MSRQHLGTPGTPFRKAFVTNSTFNGTIAIPVATATKPTGEGIVNFESDPPLSLVVIPFGAGADNATMTVRVGAWRLMSTLWVYQILCEFACTLSAYVGVAGQPLAATDRMADTIASPTALLGNLGTDCFKRSPANDSPGSMEILGHGAGIFQVDINTGGSATNGNALVGTK